MSDLKKIYILYSHFPHYRDAVFSELKKSNRYAYTFFYDEAGVDSTIRSGDAGAEDRAVRTFRLGPIMLQPGFLSTALFGRCDACIMLGNPYIVTNWLYAAILRLRGRRVLMWTHGWRRRETGAKGRLRNTYFRLADMLLLYGDRARKIGIDSGFSADRLQTIYNSLDYTAQADLRDKLGCGIAVDVARFLCVTRLIPEVRIDLAIQALAILNRTMTQPAQLVIVGDGPERRTLEKLASDQGVTVEFVGPLYEESKLAPHFLSAIAVVSPGKVGLLAIHAMAYGVPVITHDELDQQMPEVEAITPGRTGLFFRFEDAASLAGAMRTAMTTNLRDQAKVEAIQMIEERYTPEVQRNFIEAALDRLLIR